MDKTRTVVLLVGLYGILLAGCGESRDGGVEIPEARTTDSAGVSLVVNQVPGDRLPAYARLAPEPTWTLDEPREGVPGWSSVRIRGAATLSDGRVAVADGGSFRVRYYQGDSVTWSVGGRGTGPGRFMGIFGIGVGAGDTVWVADHQAHELTLLDPEGVESLEGELPVEGTVAGRFGDGSFLAIRVRPRAEGEGEPVGVRRDSADYVRWWPHTGDTAYVATFPASQRLTLDTDSGQRVTVPPPMARGTSVAVGSGRFYVGDQERSEILGLDPDGTLRQVVRLEGVDRSIDPELLSTLTLTDERGREPSWADAFWSHVPETRPAFGRLMLDARGHLWVSEHVVTGEPPRSWLVFSPTGVLQGQVEVPAGFTLLEIGTSHVLGVAGGERGAQEVRRYALDRLGR